MLGYSINTLHKYDARSLIYNHGPPLLARINFNPSMDK